jgi:hypothetical protein
MIEYTCYDCGEEQTCTSCGNLDWIEGKKYDIDDFPLELQERFVYQGQCCECGGTRVEQ